MRAPKPICSISVKREQSFLPLVTYVRSRLIKAKNILCPCEERCPRKWVVVWSSSPLRPFWKPSPCPDSRGRSLTLRASGVFRIFSALVSLVGNRTPTLCPSKNTQSSVYFFKRSASDSGSLKGPCWDKRKGRNSSYTFTETLFNVHVWSDIHRNIRITCLLLGGRMMQFASLYCLHFLQWNTYGLKACFSVLLGWTESSGTLLEQHGWEGAITVGWWIIRPNFAPSTKFDYMFLMIWGTCGFISLWRIGHWIAAETTRMILPLKKYF